VATSGSLAKDSIPLVPKMDDDIANVAASKSDENAMLYTIASVVVTKAVKGAIEETEMALASELVQRAIAGGIAEQVALEAEEHASEIASAKTNAGQLSVPLDATQASTLKSRPAKSAATKSAAIKSASPSQSTMPTRTSNATYMLFLAVLVSTALYAFTNWEAIVEFAAPTPQVVVVPPTPKLKLLGLKVPLPFLAKK